MLIPAYVWSFSLAIVERAMDIYIGIIVSELFNVEEKK
jgi:hypothetical protein